MIRILAFVFCACTARGGQEGEMGPAVPRDSVACLAGCRCGPAGQIVECPEVRPPTLK